MATIKYKVRLTPHEKFFFGGEKTFGEGKEANYFVRSNYFPQQTGVLGFVRHQLLIQCNDNNIFKNNKIQDKDKANELIGKTSFRMDNDFAFNFGKIKSLSPVFISNNQTYFFPSNKEYHFTTSKDENCNEIKIDEFLEVQLGKNPELLDYKAKLGLPDLLMDKYLNKLKYDDVFIEHKQVGIRKNYKGKSDDDAYYIQIYLKLKKDYSFVFIIELEDDVKFSNKNIVTFGGEQQTFKMEVEEFPNDFNDLLPKYKSSKNADKIVIISDAFVKNDIIDVCDFAITETIDFRFLKTETEKERNYYTRPLKSLKYNLYKKGSVFFGDIDKIKKKLKDDTFYKLGYNYYKKIKKEEL